MNNNFSFNEEVYKKPRGADESFFLNECFHSDKEFIISLNKNVNGLKVTEDRIINTIYFFKSIKDPKKYNGFYANNNGGTGVFIGSMKFIKKIIADNELKKLEVVRDNNIFNVIKKSDTKIFSLGNFIFKSQLPFKEFEEHVTIKKLSDFAGIKLIPIHKEKRDLSVEILRLNEFNNNLKKSGLLNGKKRSELIDSLNSNENCFVLINNTFYINEERFNSLTKAKKKKEIVLFIDILEKKGINPLSLINLDSLYKENNILHLFLSNLDKESFTNFFVKNYNDVDDNLLITIDFLNPVVEGDYTDCLSIIKKINLRDKITLSLVKSVKAFNWLYDSGHVDLYDIYLVKDKLIYQEMIKKMKALNEDFFSAKYHIRSFLSLASRHNNFEAIKSVVNSFSNVKKFGKDVVDVDDLYVELCDVSNGKAQQFVKIMKFLEEDLGFCKPSVKIGNYLINRNKKELFNAYYFSRECSDLDRAIFFKTAIFTKNSAEWIKDFKDRGFKIKAEDLPDIIANFKNDYLVGNMFSANLNQTIEIFKNNILGDLNSVDQSGSTLLHYLAIYRKYELLKKTIVSLEISLDKKDVNGHTFVQSLCNNLVDSKSLEEVIDCVGISNPELLTDFGLFERILKSNNLDVLKLLENKGYVFDFDKCAVNGDNVLHLVISNISRFHNCIFLERDADVLSGIIENVLEKKPELIATKKRSFTPLERISEILDRAKHEKLSSVRELSRIYSTLFKSKLDVDLVMTKNNKSKFKI